MNGVWYPNSRQYRTLVGAAQKALGRGRLVPRDHSMAIARHEYREFNVEADSLSNYEQDEFSVPLKVRHYSYLRIYFDGSITKTRARSAWILYGSDDPGQADDNWQTVAWMTFALPQGARVTAAELEACRCAVHFVENLMEAECGEDLRSFCWEWSP